MLNPTSPLPLKDPTLFRQANCIDGKWVQADSGKTIVVKNPATGEADRRGAGPRRRRDAPRHRGGASRAGRLARHAGEGARRDPAQAQRPDAGECRRPGGDHDRRTGQAAGGEQRRDRLCRQLHRVVRRGGQAHLRRHDPAECQGPPHPGAEGADRRVRRDHAVELPRRDDHAKGRPRLGRGLHRRDPPGEPDAVFGAGPRRAGRARRDAARRVQRHHRAVRRDRRGTHLQSAGAQADLHRLDRGRRQAAGAMRADDQEDQHGTGRQRAVHRVRRCGPRCRGRGRDGEQIPQHRPDLRLRQPHPGAGRRLRRIRREAEGGGGGDEGRQRHGARRDARVR